MRGEVLLDPHTHTCSGERAGVTQIHVYSLVFTTGPCSEYKYMYSLHDSAYCKARVLEVKKFFALRHRADG